MTAQTTTQNASNTATTKALRMSLKTVEEHTESKHKALASIISENEKKAAQTDDKHLLKELHDASHNAAARQKRLKKFVNSASKTQSYIFKNAKDHKATILETSSLYAFDTLLTFTQAITESKIVTRECFYVFFECFSKRSTVSAREIQKQIMRKCISQTTKENFTAESARTWTRNCFHAMNCMSAMTEEKVSKEIFYTIDVNAKFTQDLLEKTTLLMSVASEEIELDSTDIERA